MNHPGIFVYSWWWCMWVPPFNEYDVGFTSSPVVCFTSSCFHQLWIELKLPPPQLCFLGYIVCGCVGRGVCVKGSRENTSPVYYYSLLADLFNLSFSTQQGTGGSHPPKHTALWGPGSPHTPHRLLPPHHHSGISSPNQLSVPPDPFNRKVSRHPKKFLTQSSSRFQPQKPPPDYKPLPHLKGRKCVAIFMAHGQSNGIACASQLYFRLASYPGSLGEGEKRAWVRGYTSALKLLPPSCPGYSSL